MRTTLVIILLGSLSCCTRHGQQPPAAFAEQAASADKAHDAQAVPTTPAPPELITADSPRVTRGAVKYVAPAGWTHATRDSVVVLTAQEGDAKLAIVDAPQAEPDAAVAAAWLAYQSKPPPPLKLAIDTPARDGWEQIRQYVYEVPPNERRAVNASARRHGKAWTVLLVEAAHATLEKRNAQFALLGKSIRPSAYEVESFAGKRAHKLDAGRLAKLDALVELGRRELGVPGVSVAIVEDGKLIHAKGYGVRELNKATPVDADSLFQIASNTKALSTLLLAELVDDGKLRWDQPVTEVYPEFKLGNAETTAATRIEHLICACTGLPRKDMTWLFEFGSATPRSAMESLAKVQPTTRFGETFQYSNLLAGAAGYTAARVLAPQQELGKGYDTAMQRRVFEPLGMTRTTFDIQRVLATNHASPHAWSIDAAMQLTSVELVKSVHPLRPAGGAWSSARDLIKYVQLELQNGVAPNGKRLVSEANLLKRRAKYVSMGENRHYGMGLMVDATYATPVVEHGGSMPGYRSNMFWLPEHNVGAVILTNADMGGGLLGPFKRHVLELLFDGKPEAIDDLKAGGATAREALAKERARLVVPAAAEAVANLGKRYTSAELGTLQVKTAAGGTHFDFGEWQSAVASRKNDDGTLSFVTVTPGRRGFSFVVGTPAADGRRRLILRDAQHEYPFEEVLAERAR